MRSSKGVNGLTVLTLSALLGWSCGVSANDSPAGLARDRQSTAQALKEKNPQRAIKIIEPWFKKRPDDIEIANDYAITLAQLGRLDQAREVLEQALSKNQQTSLVFQNLREILSQQAAISYAKAMGKKPPNQQVALKGGITIAEAPVTASKADTRVAADSSAKAEAARESDLKSESKRDLKAPATIELKGDTRKDATKTAARTDSKSEESVLAKATEQWSDAWESKDFNKYLAAYSEKFEPQQFPTREAWAAHRKPRVTKPGPIVVKVSDIRVKVLSASRAEVKFLQRYESGNLKLNSIKTLIWIKEDSGWKILREEGR
jgi:tetratricopeptide (TPR) repeat protein